MKGESMSQPVGQSTEGNGATNAPKESLLKGMSLSKILNDIGKELKDQAAHGSHEMASMLFRGDAFVMYPRSEDLEQQLQGQQEVQQEQDRGGRE
jgi:hypothetical protein